MSTHPSTASLDVLHRSDRSVGLLADVDALLEDVIGQLRGILVEVGGEPPVPSDNPLGVDLVGELAQRVRHHGKRLRPILAGWGWEVAGGDPRTRDELVRVAAALELLQLFALVQDDVMDRSDERRGRPSLHVVASSRHRAGSGLGDPDLFGDSVAVLVADLALSEATLLAAQGGPVLARAWRTMATELVEGQLLDVTHTAGRDRDLVASRRIARLKSGRYTITRPLELGALVAGAQTGLVTRLMAWGDLVGDAFALRDDILGVWGDPDVTGKPAGDDLRSGKPTVLLVWAEEMLGERGLSLLAASDAGALDDEGVRSLQREMRDSGVLARAEETVTGLVLRSNDALDDLAPEPATAESLRALAHTVAWRTR